MMPLADYDQALLVDALEMNRAAWNFLTDVADQFPHWYTPHLEEYYRARARGLSVALREIHRAYRPRYFYGQA